VTTLWTVGHWTWSQEEFLELLAPDAIEQLVDVRALPGSRRSPQFDAERMQTWLAAAGIDYRHDPDLTGRRRRQDVDPAINAGWQNVSFKNYADHTLGPAYRSAIERLELAATERRTVIMCGEPMPWRCHRLLISNTVVARGGVVWHLMGRAPRQPHELGRWGATPQVGPGGHVTYPS